MLDIKFVRNNPDVVKQNIKNKFQDEKLPLVDEVIELDQKNRDIKGEVEALRAEKNKISKQIGACMAQGKKEEAEELKRQVAESAARIEELSKEEKEDSIYLSKGHSNKILNKYLFPYLTAPKLTVEEYKFINLSLYPLSSLYALDETFSITDKASRAS